MVTKEQLEKVYDITFKKQAEKWRHDLLISNRMSDMNFGSAGGPAWTTTPEESKWIEEGGPVPESVKNPGREKQRIHWDRSNERCEVSPEFWDKYYKSQDKNKWLDQWLETYG